MSEWSDFVVEEAYCAYRRTSSLPEKLAPMRAALETASEVRESEKVKPDYFTAVKSGDGTVYETVDAGPALFSHERQLQDINRRLIALETVARSTSVDQQQSKLDRRCGTCSFFNKRKNDTTSGWCIWAPQTPPPMWFYSSRFVTSLDGRNCAAWAQMKEIGSRGGTLS